jgi:antibiotic biosynthesis monooxygenase (ABM) superfamily enzyme
MKVEKPVDRWLSRLESITSTLAWWSAILVVWLILYPQVKALLTVVTE